MVRFRILRDEGYGSFYEGFVFGKGLGFLGVYGFNGGLGGVATSGGDLWPVIR